jgi:hypothetical protein
MRMRPASGLLEQHRPTEALDPRLIVFRRWPSSTTAARLHKAVCKSWSDYHDEVVATLAASPVVNSASAISVVPVCR